MAYLYFNKTTFRRLLRLWRKVLKGNDYSLLLRDDEWLMENFIPLRFIEDIENELYERKIGRWNDKRF